MTQVKSPGSVLRRQTLNAPGLITENIGLLEPVVLRKITIANFNAQNEMKKRIYLAMVRNGDAI